MNALLQSKANDVLFNEIAICVALPLARDHEAGSGSDLERQPAHDFQEFGYPLEGREPSDKADQRSAVDTETLVKIDRIRVLGGKQGQIDRVVNQGDPRWRYAGRDKTVNVTLGDRDDSVRPVKSMLLDVARTKRSPNMHDVGNAEAPRDEAGIPGAPHVMCMNE